MTILAYSTIESVRNIGVSAVRISDSEVDRLIRQYSKMITKLLNTWFAPVLVTQRYNGGCLVLNTALPPVIDLMNINIVNSDQSRTAIDKLEYEGIGKIIKFNSRPLEGVKNIEVTGIFGEIENNKKIPVKITSDIVEGSTYFNVEDVSELEAKDIFVFDNKILIANSIDYDLNRIIIDKQSNIKPILTNSETICYGSVPCDIENAINLLIKHNKSLENQFGGKIKSERTDDYSYDLFQSGNYSTGVPEVDRILQNYIDSDIVLTYL